MKVQEFSRQTQFYSLNGTFDGKTLSLSLFDFDDCVKYQGKFTNKDTSIHKKADLKDLYEALFVLKPTDETEMENNGKNTKGKAINSPVLSRDGIECYSVQQKGVIDVFTVLRNELTKLTRTYTSRLQLLEVENMTEQQTLGQIQKVQQSVIRREYQDKILSIKKQLTESFEVQKLNMKEQIANKIQEIQSLQANTNKIKQFESFQKQMKQKWHNKFTFDGKTLQRTGDGGSLRQFVFFEEIPFDEQFTFKIKIVKSPSKNIYIGVVDYQKQKQQQYSYGSNNAVCYRTNGGYKYPNGGTEGGGVNDGETVEVKVDRKINTIKWVVNNQQRATFIHPMLGEKDRKFMPYIDTLYAGDIIEWSR